MESFLCNLIIDLNLENFGITYEELIPICCGSLYTKKWVRKHDSCIQECAEVLSQYIFKTKNKVEYLEFKNKVENIASFYWPNIVDENREFEKIQV